MTTLEYFQNNSIIRKYPKYRNDFVNGSWKWLEGRRADDGALDYWRVHDKLYDLTNFIELHPGGKAWLELTKVSFQCKDSLSCKKFKFYQHKETGCSQTLSSSSRSFFSFLFVRREQI